LSPEDLEKTYQSLALNIDKIGEDNSELFLAKLVLLLAHESGNFEEVQQHINNAAASLSE